MEPEILLSAKPARRLGPGCALCLVWAWACFVMLTEASVYAGVTVQSRSGQFIVHSVLPTVPSLGQLITRTNRPPLLLEPDALAVTAERIKRHVLMGVALQDRWRGKVHLWIYPRAAPVDFLPVGATRFADGWQYSVRLPEQCRAPVLVRSLVQSVLLEVANRSDGGSGAEIPIWLLEGMTGQMLTRVGSDIVVRSNPLVGKTGNQWGQLLPSSRQSRLGDHLLAMRRHFGDRQPVSFNELSLPSASSLAGERLETYRLSAQLFFESLQRLEGGKRALGEMVQGLAQSKNWQTAFQAAFRQHFARLLDVEQWWAVALQQFVGQVQSGVWTVDRLGYSLEEALTVSVEVQPDAGSPPRRQAVSVSEVVRDWPPSLQRTVLREKLGQLRVIEVNAPPDWARLAAGYSEVLTDYGEELAQLSGGAAARRRIAVNRPALVRATLRRLAGLDVERRELMTPEVVLSGEQPGRLAERNATRDGP